MPPKNDIIQKLSKSDLFLALQTHLVHGTPLTFNNPHMPETLPDEVWREFIKRDFDFTFKIESSLSPQLQYTLFIQFVTIEAFVNQFKKTSGMFDSNYQQNMECINEWSKLSDIEKIAQTSTRWDEIVKSVRDFLNDQRNTSFVKVLLSAIYESEYLLNFLIPLLPADEQKIFLGLILKTALSNNKFDAAIFLQNEMNADINTPLVDEHPCFIECRSPEAIEYAIKHGADKDIQSLDCEFRGNTALSVQIQYALKTYGRIRERTQENINTLLKHKVDVNSKNAFGKTALHILLESRSLSAHAPDYAIVHQLIQAGGSLNIKDNAGETPFLALLKQENCYLLAKQIIEQYLPQLDLSLRDPEGYTALMLAINQKENQLSLPQLEKLIPNSTHVNTRASNGQTALIIAAQYKNTDLTKFLLAKGADVSVQDNEGKTALNHAMEPFEYYADRPPFAPSDEFTQIFIDKTENFTLKESNALMEKVFQEPSLPKLNQLLAKTSHLYHIIVNDNCNTPMTLALKKLRSETNPSKREILIQMMTTLLERGASTGADTNGDTPFSLAMQSNSNVPFALKASIIYHGMRFSSSTLPAENVLPVASPNVELSLMTIRLGIVYPTHQQIKKLAALGFEEKNLKGVREHYYWSFDPSLPNIFTERSLYNHDETTCDRVFYGDKCIMSNDWLAINPIYIELDKVEPRNKPKSLQGLQRIALGQLKNNQLELFKSVGFQVHYVTQEQNPFFQNSRPNDSDYIEVVGNLYYLNINGINKNIDVTCTQQSVNKHDYEVRMDKKLIVRASQETPPPPSTYLSCFQRSIIQRPVSTYAIIYENVLEQEKRITENLNQQQFAKMKN